MSSNNNTSGTAASEKSKLPFYNVFSRNSTDSAHSTDALLQKEQKKDKDTSENVSAKSIMQSEYTQKIDGRVLIPYSGSKQLRQFFSIDWDLYRA